MTDNDLCETPQPTQQSVLNRVSKDRFLLVLNLPLILKKQSLANNLINLDPLQISVFGTIVPPSIVPSTEVRFGGQSYNASSYSRPNYPPLTVNFVIDNKFRNYWLLWQWLAVMNDPRLSKYTGPSLQKTTLQDKIDSGTCTEYQTNFSVIGLNEYNQQTIEFIYYNGFITNLGGITYDYTDTELIKSTAEFQFSQLDIKLL